MTNEERLEGWLVILRANLGQDRPFCMPEPIRHALVEMGWVRYLAERPGARYTLQITEAGWTRSDLCAPEWGFDPVGSMP